MKHVIHITPSAAEQIVQLCAQNPGQLLRVGVNNKGCSGHTYTFDWITPDQVQKWDEQVSVQDVTVIVDVKSVLKLMGSTLDYERTLFHEKFVWHNPLVQHTCGCGESVGF